jgi:anti-sigma factor RsiW
MNCQHAQNLISSFIDHELSAEETRELRKHLFSCSECENEYQELLHLKEFLENVIQEPLDFDPLVNLHSRLSKEEDSFFPFSNHKIWVRRLGIVAACFVIYFVTSTLLFPDNRNNIPQLSVKHSELNSTPVAWDQNISIDQSVSVYQASLILP